MRKFLNKIAVGSVAAVSASASFADPIDTSSVTSALTSAGTAAATVGAAVLVVIVGIKAFKFIRQAM